MNAAPRGRCRCSAGRLLAVAFDFDGEFKNFATAKIPRRNATDHDELYQPLDKLTDCQPAAHRVAQMVSRAANVAGLDVEQNEDEFLRPDIEMPFGWFAEDEVTQPHITEKGFRRMLGQDKKALGNMAVRLSDLLERRVERRRVWRLARCRHHVPLAPAQGRSFARKVRVAHGAARPAMAAPQSQKKPPKLKFRGPASNDQVD